MSEPAAPPEEPQMEFHKPKPVHSWRELLTEIGVIVIGVAIALAAEQAVEWLHWQGEVRAARQAITAEMTANNTNLFVLRAAIAPCVERQLDEAAAILSALEAGRKPGQFTNFKGALSSLVRDSEWQSERASQVLTHFPRDSLALMGRYYAQLPDFRDWQVAEEAAWRELGVLRDPPTGMTVSDLIRLRVSLATARGLENRIVGNAKRELTVSHQLGIADAPVDTVRVKNFCTMNEEDYQRYRSTQELR